MNKKNKVYKKIEFFLLQEELNQPTIATSQLIFEIFNPAKHIKNG
jgi:hypothetical protein